MVIYQKILPSIGDQNYDDILERMGMNVRELQTTFNTWATKNSSTLLGCTWGYRYFSILDDKHLCLIVMNGDNLNDIYGVGMAWEKKTSSQYACMNLLKNNEHILKHILPKPVDLSGPVVAFSASIEDLDDEDDGQDFFSGGRNIPPLKKSPNIPKPVQQTLTPLETAKILPQTSLHTQTSKKQGESLESYYKRMVPLVPRDLRSETAKILALAHYFGANVSSIHKDPLTAPANIDKYLKKNKNKILQQIPLNVRNFFWTENCSKYVLILLGCHLALFIAPPLPTIRYVVDDDNNHYAIISNSDFAFAAGKGINKEVARNVCCVDFVIKNDLIKLMSLIDKDKDVFCLYATNYVTLETFRTLVKAVETDFDNRRRSYLHPLVANVHTAAPTTNTTKSLETHKAPASTLPLKTMKSNLPPVPPNSRYPTHFTNPLDEFGFLLKNCSNEGSPQVPKISSNLRCDNLWRTTLSIPCQPGLFGVGQDVDKGRSLFLAAEMYCSQVRLSISLDPTEPMTLSDRFEDFKIDDMEHRSSTMLSLADYDQEEGFMNSSFKKVTKSGFIKL